MLKSTLPVVLLAILALSACQSEKNETPQPEVECKIAQHSFSYTNNPGTKDENGYTSVIINRYSEKGNLMGRTWETVWKSASRDSSSFSKSVDIDVNEYDEEGFLVKQKTTIGANNYTKTRTYEYQSGKLSKIMHLEINKNSIIDDETTGTTTYAYDQQGQLTTQGMRLTSVTTTNAGVSTNINVNRWQYEYADGKVSKHIYTFTYESSVKGAESGAETSTEIFTRNAQGQVIKLEANNVARSEATDIITYQLNADGDPTSEETYRNGKLYSRLTRTFDDKKNWSILNADQYKGHPVYNYWPINKHNTLREERVYYAVDGTEESRATSVYEYAYGAEGYPTSIKGTITRQSAKGTSTSINADNLVYQCK